MGHHLGQQSHRANQPNQLRRFDLRCHGTRREQDTKESPNLGDVRLAVLKNQLKLQAHNDALIVQLKREKYKGVCHKHPVG